jgi:hypothetical protein
MEKNMLAAIQAAIGLITAGTEIFMLLKGKESLTDEEIQAIIDTQNEKQAAARAALLELLK